MAAATPSSPGSGPTYALGTIEASEQLIRDLYLDLRVRIRKWATLTKQTAQARMGYVGQHLVSVATGCPGGKSGARGHDLILPSGAHAEIKTCYRVDQLGQCNACKAGLAPMETQCSECGSSDVTRRDDSKWLIGIRNADEFEKLTDPALYYLVLFEFTDFLKPDTISASIWSVDPQTPGFILCMIDYYLTIRANSKSGAPFNLWPHSFKFELMRPVRIYNSIIRPDDTIDTRLFPGRDTPQPQGLKSLLLHASSQALALDVAVAVSAKLGLPAPKAGTKKLALLTLMEAHRQRDKIGAGVLCDLFTRALYVPRITPHLRTLSPKMRKLVTAEQ